MLAEEMHTSISWKGLGCCINMAVWSPASADHQWIMSKGEAVPLTTGRSASSLPSWGKTSRQTLVFQPTEVQSPLMDLLRD